MLELKIPLSLSINNTDLGGFKALDEYSLQPAYEEPLQGADVLLGAPDWEPSRARGSCPDWPELPCACYEEEPPELPWARYWEELPELPCAHYEEEPSEPPQPCCYLEEPPEHAWPDFPEELPDLPPSPGREEPMLIDWPGPGATDEVRCLLYIMPCFTAAGPEIQPGGQSCHLQERCLCIMSPSLANALPVYTAASIGWPGQLKQQRVKKHRQQPQVPIHRTSAACP
ncbi:uncharacterized protein LOC120403945 [Mauremys reevesii]|uniref:uncharacterized protein LOC120403945 n=1 Tax=Mauremys reevesii TaxID=260615 RepID=UPI00193FE714|nr:uncharacterized protein LOC120403945 [Mauremys reevesii]